jgi:hypothetical protein
MKSPVLKKLKPPPKHDFIITKVGPSLKVFNNKGVKSNFGDVTPVIQYACASMCAIGWANEIVRFEVMRGIPIDFEGSSIKELKEQSAEASAQFGLWLDFACSLFTNHIKNRGESAVKTRK